MMIYPRRGQSGQVLETALAEVANSVRNAGHPPAIVDSYLQWVADAERMCRLPMRQADLNRLILTPRYWATLASPAQNSFTSASVGDEVLARQNDLDAALTELRDVRRRWTTPLHGRQAVVVADTNVFLHHPNEIDEIDWHAVVSSRVRNMTNIRLVVPLLVIDELDNAKRGNQRSRARSTLKKLFNWFDGFPTGRRKISGRQELRGEVTAELLLDDLGHRRLERPDDEIIDRSAALASLIDHEVNLVTYDTGAALRAQTAGLFAHRLEHN